jgi:hypothetical protein
MSDPTQVPAVSAPPSARRLLRSLAVSAVVAIAILVAIVLPAEYGVDPTGIGRVLGLQQMGALKMALAAEVAEHAAEEEAASVSAVAAPPPDSASKPEVTALTLPPGDGKEIKLVMRKDAIVGFVWATNRGSVNYDMHADSPAIKYHGYAKGNGVRADSGALIAAFDGQHGWFWRNRGSDTVIVTLRVVGEYQELKRMP